MLKRLRLKDFKSFVDEDVPLAPLTLLLGANASGKSNFLDALQFLHANSFNLDLEQILNGEKRNPPDTWRGLRGGPPRPRGWGHRGSRSKVTGPGWPGISTMNPFPSTLSASPIE
ncbi:AAA family ATPase [Cystobacter fuscus]